MTFLVYICDFCGDQQDDSTSVEGCGCLSPEGARHLSEIEAVPASVAERLTTALALLRGYVTDDEGWKLINDALWLGARDENDEPIYG
jgi:hypothetical protein